jgi:hypothetical protein
MLLDILQTGNRKHSERENEKEGEKDRRTTSKKPKGLSKRYTLRIIRIITELQPKLLQSREECTNRTGHNNNNKF